MIGMQSTLDRILAAVQTQTQTNQAIAQQSGLYPPQQQTQVRSVERYGEVAEGLPRPRFPPLPGFAPPVSKCR
jgi:type II secretory pathway component PulF